MRSFGDIRGLLSVMFVLAALLYATHVRSQDEMYGVRMPLEHYEDGTVKTRLVSDVMRYANRDVIHGQGVTVTFMDPDGATNTVLKADACTYDRKQKTGGSETSPVTLDRADVYISGTGFKWDDNTKRVTVLKNSRVVIRKGFSLGKAMARPGRKGAGE